MDKNKIKIYVSQNKLYYFKETIEKVENSSQPWYDACKNCSRLVIKTDGEVRCRSCSETKPMPIHENYMNIYIKIITYESKYL